MKQGLCAAWVLALLGTAVRADVVDLHDGSRLIGRVTSLTADKLVMTTRFADPLEIETSLVRGITTDHPLAVQLQSGDRAVGVMRYSPEQGQQVTATALGQITVPLEGITAAWVPGEPDPFIPDTSADRPRWSGRLEAGLDGQSGNTERVAIDGRVEVSRETDADRLLIYAQGRFARENGQDTAKEVVGGLKLEVDLNPDWFAFGRFELEFDEFEDLDLRTTVSGGVGHFVIRQPRQTLKARVGLGFQNESFNTGVSDEQAIAELGLDYQREFAPWLMYTHSTTWYPTFEDLGDYRLTMENAAEVPLNPEKTWKLRIGMRNNFDAMPEPGNETLDTSYFLNLVWDWM